MFLYSVYDKVAKTYSTPFGFVNDGMAKRDFGLAVKNPNNPIHATPHDYVLYCLGEFDQEEGVIVSQTAFQICSGADFMEE